MVGCKYRFHAALINLDFEDWPSTYFILNMIFNVIMFFDFIKLKNEIEILYDFINNEK